jgi:hypothetical protein
MESRPTKSSNREIKTTLNTFFLVAGSTSAAMLNSLCVLVLVTRHPPVEIKLVLPGFRLNLGLTVSGADRLCLNQ